MIVRFYRYVWTVYAEHDFDGELCSPKFPSPKLELNEYELTGETPKGYWIGYSNEKLKWVPKESRKRYAYPTKEAALENFIKRTRKRVKIIEYDLDCCKKALVLAQQEVNKNNSLMH